MIFPVIFNADGTGLRLLQNLDEPYFCLAKVYYAKEIDSSCHSETTPMKPPYFPRCLTASFEWYILWFMNISVDCYAGYRGEETPRRFRLGQRGVEIIKVLDRWLAPDRRYFKVLGDDNAIYILRHNVATWDWELTFFKQISDSDKWV